MKIIVKVGNSNHQKTVSYDYVKRNLGVFQSVDYCELRFLTIFNFNRDKFKTIKFSRDYIEVADDSWHNHKFIESNEDVVVSFEKP